MDALSTKATAAVNGFISELVSYEAGVRQGCPLAPAAYLFIAWALWCLLQDCPAVGVQVLPNLAQGDQYADNTMAILKSLSSAHVQQFLNTMSTFAKASGQHLNLPKSSLIPLGVVDLPLPASVCGLKVATEAVSLGVTFSNDCPAVSAPPGGWAPLQDKVAAAFGKVAKLPLSAFGRATAAFGYGVNKLLFHAEHNGLPPLVLKELIKQSYGFVDRGLPPPARGKRYPTSPLPGVDSHLMAGRPVDGGFGAIPLKLHLHARGAMAGRRLITWLAGDPSHLASGQQRCLQRIMSRPEAPAAASLPLEDQLLLTVPPVRPTWVHLAAAILERTYPTSHPALALLEAARAPPPEQQQQHEPQASPLPGPLLRMASGLGALGPVQILKPFRASVGPWCQLVPLWGNPFLQLERPEALRSVT